MNTANELLEKVLNELLDFGLFISEELEFDIRAYLAAQGSEPQPFGNSEQLADSAKTEQEPVALMISQGGAKFEFDVLINGYETCKEVDIYPLYLRPAPSRKPLTEREMFDAFYDRNYANDELYVRVWAAGVRFAEKHHGVGENNE